MNKYFHAFVPGFNNWYIVSAALIVVAALIGLLAVRVKEVRVKDTNRKGRLIKVTTRTTDIVVTAILAIVVCYMIYVESFDGILQWWDNHTGTQYGDPTGFYSLMLAGMTPTVVSAVIWGIYFFAFRLAKYAKINRIKATLKESKTPYAVRKMRTVFDSAVDLCAIVVLLIAFVGHKIGAAIERVANRPESA